MSTKTLEQETAEAVKHYMSTYDTDRVRLRHYFAAQRKKEEQAHRDMGNSRPADGGLVGHLLKMVKECLAKRLK